MKLNYVKGWVKYSQNHLKMPNVVFFGLFFGTDSSEGERGVRTKGEDTEG